MAKSETAPTRWKTISAYLVLFDVLAIFLSYFFALFLRFDLIYSRIPQTYLRHFLMIMPPYILLSIFIYWYAKLYQSIWRFASYSELARLILSNLSAICFLVSGTFIIGWRMPLFFYFIGGLLQFGLTTAIRFSYRFILLQRSTREKEKTIAHDKSHNILLVGAGNAGQMVLRDIQKSEHLHDRVCVFVDDDPNKLNRYVESVPVQGKIEDIPRLVEEKNIGKIYICIPTASPLRKKEILELCKKTGCELKILPGIYQIANGEVTLESLKKVELEDLLGRDPIRVNLDEIFQYLSNKVILVTGGGGSIGSELCRQIAAHNPKTLIIVDIYENNAHAIGLELKDKYPTLDLHVLIGSVRDADRMQDIFAIYKPQVVYHAAAHKHVPLMEDSPRESIKNNVLGTYKTAYAAMINGCERFVLISTDKAVNPTNIMGASKRLCEMVIQTFDKMIKEGKADQLPDLRMHGIQEHDYKFEAKPKNEANQNGNNPITNGENDSLLYMEEKIQGEQESNEQNQGKTIPYPKTEFVAVRFGNVLGSNGSVIPRFKEQIEKGGPVTVTHPDIIRYFMTIPEAVSLVLQAGTYAHGGEIFVLDMGDPVKIDTLARNMIHLSGLKPDEDIQIVYTGLRPGEKLFEEKLMAEEGIQKTENSLIHIGKPIAFNEEEFIGQLLDLTAKAYDSNSDIKRVVKAVVVTYKEPEEINDEVMSNLSKQGVDINKLETKKNSDKTIDNLKEKEEYKDDHLNIPFLKA